MLVLFFWVWNLAKSYFCGLANFLAIFLSFAKFPLFFWVWQISSNFFESSNFCITHLKPLNEEHTVLKNKIIVAFHVYSNYDHQFILSYSIFWIWILGHSIFGFKFRVILFFWEVEICSRTSIPVKESACVPPWVILRMDRRKSFVSPRQYRSCFSQRITALLPRN